MSAESVPIPNLRLFSSGSFIWRSDVASAVATNYPTIKRLRLVDSYSSATLLKFVECCRGLEEVSIRDRSRELHLSHRDFKAISYLPLLKSLRIECRVTGEVDSALSKCKGLDHLSLTLGKHDLSILLPAIGRNLSSPKYTASEMSSRTVSLIVVHCPALEMLAISWNLSDFEKKIAAVILLRRGLKKLSKLKVNGDSIRLGTYWEGYR
jgi:hypothetical protein